MNVRHILCSVTHTYKHTRIHSHISCQTQPLHNSIHRFYFNFFFSFCAYQKNFNYKCVSMYWFSIRFTFQYIEIGRAHAFTLDNLHRTRIIMKKKNFFASKFQACSKRKKKSTLKTFAIRSIQSLSEYLFAM